MIRFVHMPTDPSSFVFYLAIAGTLFAGCLAMVRIVKKRCALNESCPYVFGVPACFIGFMLFFAVLSASASGRFGVASETIATSAVFWLSIAGALFAAKLTVDELRSELKAKQRIVLPTCAYGCVVFTAIIAILALN